ncbi:hypothetical protein BHM03_00024926 [Ensete ventricosum]|nr:hypothetical protein BHM03_00024926 [Ensete ventricosum]
MRRRHYPHIVAGCARKQRYAGEEKQLRRVEEVDSYWCDCRATGITKSSSSSSISRLNAEGWNLFSPLSNVLRSLPGVSLQQRRWVVEGVVQERSTEEEEMSVAAMSENRVLLSVKPMKMKMLAPMVKASIEASALESRICEALLMGNGKIDRRSAEGESSSTGATQDLFKARKRRSDTAGGVESNSDGCCRWASMLVQEEKLIGEQRASILLQTTIGSESRRCLRGRGGHPLARPAATSLAASRGDGVDRRGGRPLAGQLPTAKGNRRLRRGNDDSIAVRVKEG